ncbi:MAG: sugar phosphate isomerase/epimerase [Kordiimonadaceae bacterium]|nr:sugar phosphate isomerase/epimerase [Kordiimonadaceae bacterium]MBT6033640.1 sugar phosphate isomerase/epimerase [Kordiimonadaceae bacterium]
MRRRSFVKSTAGLGLLGLTGMGGLLSSCAETPVKNINNIGLQLYTVRDLMDQDVEGTIAKVAETGYKEVEFAGYFDRSAAQIKSILDQNGLIAPSVHINPIELEVETMKSVIANAKIIGHDYVVMSWIPPEGRERLDQYKDLIEAMNVAGEMCKAAGLQLAYHNHDFEFFDMEGVKPYDLILSEVSADLLKMELDIYWIMKASDDPFAYFDQYPGRFTMCHVKDMGADGAIVDVGRGTIDFNNILARREQAGIEHYFVEMDNPTDSLETIRYSYESAKKIQIG